MKLRDKGRFAPPPELPQHAQAVSVELAGWTDVHARTHWRLGDDSVVDGADFYLGQDEIGHIHLDGEAHIAVPKALRDALIAAGLAKPFRWSPAFVVASIRRPGDGENAKRIFRLAYDRRRGVAEVDLLARIAQDAGVSA